MKWIVGLVAVGLVSAIWAWAVYPPIIERDTPVPYDRWVRVTTKGAGFSYRTFLVTLADGSQVHVEGTHYIVTDERPAHLQVKDASRNMIVFASGRVLEVSEERTP